MRIAQNPGCWRWCAASWNDSGFATRDLGLIEAMLRVGHIALGLDGTNEADRDLALAAFATQFPQT